MVYFNVMLMQLQQAF